MNLLSAIAQNELKTFFRSKPAYLWVLVLPLGFVYLMALAAPKADTPHNRAPLVTITNADSGFMGQVLAEELSAENLQITKKKEKSFSDVTTINLPENLTANILQGKSTSIEIVDGTNVDKADAAIVRARAIRSLMRFNDYLLEGILATGANALTELQITTSRKQDNVVTLTSIFAGRAPIPTGYNFSLPGNLVMFIVLNLVVFGGSAMATDRNRGTINRMLAHQINPRDIVLGKVLGLMLVASLQIIVFIFLGKFLFRLNIGSNLPAILLVLLMLAWVAGSLGVAIGSLTRSYDRVGGICVLSSMAMGVLGGCWFPLEFAPSGFKILALLTPTGWSLKALHQLISFGSGFTAAIAPMIALFVLGCSINVIAIRFFRR